MARSLSAWAAFAAIMTAMLAFGGNRPMPWTLLSLAIFLIAAVRFLIDLAQGELMRSSRRQARLTLPVVLALSVMLHQGALLEFAPAPADAVTGWQSLMKLSAYCLCFWLGVEGGAVDGFGRRLVEVTAITGALVSLYAIIVHLTHQNPLLGGVAVGQGATGPFVSRNSFAFYAALSTVAALACFDRRQFRLQPGGGRWRDLAYYFVRKGAWLFFLLALISFIGVALSTSRGGLLTALLGGALFLALRPSTGEGRSARPQLLVIGFLLVAGLVLAGAGVLERLDQTAGPDAGRAYVSAETWRLILERPWTGYGLGAYQQAFRPHVDAAFATLEWHKAHNLFLEMMFELGVPAAIAWFGAVGLVAWRVWLGVRERQRKRDVVVFTFAMLLMGAFHSAVDFPLQMPATACLFALLLGAGWSSSFSSRRRSWG